MRVTRQPHFTELTAHGVVHDDFSRCRAAVAGQQLNRFHRLQRTDGADQRRHDAGFDAGEGVFAKQAAQAAVAGFIFLIRKDADLPFHANRRAGDQRRFMAETSGVELVTDRDVVGTVEHQIVGGDLRRQRLVFQPRVERRELNVGINPRQRGAGGVDLRLADGVVAVQRLALKVGLWFNYYPF